MSRQRPVVCNCIRKVDVIGDNLTLDWRFTGMHREATAKAEFRGRTIVFANLFDDVASGENPKQIERLLKARKSRTHFRKRDPLDLSSWRKLFVPSGLCLRIR